MNNTREAALEDALKEIMSSDSCESRETFDGSNKHVVITKFGEFGQIAHEALSTPATEPQGYVEGLEDYTPNIGAATNEPSIRELVRSYYKPHFDEAKVEILTRDYLNALAARPAPQPAADTRVVAVQTLDNWQVVAENHGLYLAEEIRAIIGTATPAPSDKSAEAVRNVRPEAIDALAAYQQADMDGVMVLVSRQAIEECLPALRALAGKGE